MGATVGPCLAFELVLKSQVFQLLSVQTLNPKVYASSWGIEACLKTQAGSGHTAKIGSVIGSMQSAVMLMFGIVESPTLILDVAVEVYGLQ